MDEKLQPLREAIDQVDRKLVELLNERARLALEVGHVKRTSNAPVYRPEREAEVLRKVAALNPGPLTEAAVTGVFREVISACRALERPLRVAYLGPPGTFSELAMIKQFGSGIGGEPAVSIDEVFRAAETGAADFAVVPVENSTEGAVSRSLDLLLVTPLKILAEVSVPVRHHLLTLSGTLDGIRRVVTHPQTLGQCAGWLNQHAAHLERVPVASNAEAAKIAAHDPSAAAIAGENAASLYGLAVAAGHIQDDPQNRTRFVVLGRQKTTPSGRDKTSLILSTRNVPGAIQELLTPLAKNGVSMTRLESRPARTGRWEYVFYVDIEGHAQDAPVARALAGIERKASFVKNLGSYPAAFTR